MTNRPWRDHSLRPEPPKLLVLQLAQHLLVDLAKALRWAVLVRTPRRRAALLARLATRVLVVCLSGTSGCRWGLVASGRCGTIERHRPTAGKEHLQHVHQPCGRGAACLAIGACSAAFSTVVLFCRWHIYMRGEEGLTPNTLKTPRKHHSESSWSPPHHPPPSPLPLPLKSLNFQKSKNT